MVVDKIHEINSFKQKKWLGNYKNFITQKRNKAKSDFEKDFNKLLNNAFYGNCMENLRKRLEVEFKKKDYYKNFKNNNLN